MRDLRLEFWYFVWVWFAYVDHNDIEIQFKIFLSYKVCWARSGGCSHLLWLSKFSHFFCGCDSSHRVPPNFGVYKCPLLQGLSACWLDKLEYETWSTLKNRVSVFAVSGFRFAFDLWETRWRVNWVTLGVPIYLQFFCPKIKKYIAIK